MKLLLLLLKTYGFKLIVNNSFDGVIDPEEIDHLQCKDELLTIFFTLESEKLTKTLKVVKIEFPPPNLLDSCWILVYIDCMEQFDNFYSSDPIEAGV